MNVTIERDALKAALARVKPAVLRGGQVALAGVLLDAHPAGLTLTATSLDARIETTVAAHPTGNGTALVPHGTLEPVVRNCPAGAVHLRHDNDELHVAAGPVNARLRTLDATTFPAPPPMALAQEAKLDDDWRAIQRVLHARGIDPTRPILTGIHFGDGHVEATDSYRLARHDVDTAAAFLLEPTCLGAAAKACPDGPVTLRWHGTRFELEADDTIWSGQTIEGQFPPCNGLFPASTPLSITCDRATLMEAVRAASAIGEETYENAAGNSYTTSTVRLTLAPDTVTVRCLGIDIGTAEVAVPATCAGGGEVAFNPRYLHQMLGALDGDQVTLKGVDGRKPWVVVEGGFSQLLMPVVIGARAS